MMIDFGILVINFHNPFVNFVQMTIFLLCSHSWYMWFLLAVVQKWIVLPFFLLEGFILVFVPMSKTLIVCEMRKLPFDLEVNSWVTMITICIFLPTLWLSCIWCDREDLIWSIVGKRVLKLQDSFVFILWATYFVSHLLYKDIMCKLLICYILWSISFFGYGLCKSLSFLLLD